jgi:integrase
LRKIVCLQVHRRHRPRRAHATDEGGTWAIPAARYKTGIDLELPLSDAAQSVLATVARFTDTGFVFTLNGKKGMTGFSKFKREFDERMLAELRTMAGERGDDPEAITLERWTIHDLRRTARSLMTQAGIAPDHAERALGHVIGGVRGVYDRHDYHAEKRAAFDALARRIDLILNPVANVVRLRPAG